MILAVIQSERRRERMVDFTGTHFEQDIILAWVHW